MGDDLMAWKAITCPKDGHQRLKLYEGFSEAQFGTDFICIYPTDPITIAQNIRLRRVCASVRQVFCKTHLRQVEDYLSVTLKMIVETKEIGYAVACTYSSQILSKKQFPLRHHHLGCRTSCNIGTKSKLFSRALLLQGATLLVTL